jgi:hypothetical protein
MNLKILATSLAAVTLLASAATAGSVELIQNNTFSGPSSSTNFTATNMVSNWTVSNTSPYNMYYTFVYVGNTLNATVSENGHGSDFTMYNSATTAGKTFPSGYSGYSGNLQNIQTLTTAAQSSGAIAGYSGNFIAADGSSGDNTTISQTIAGLTIGDSYTLTFGQAAGQQANYGCISSLSPPYSNCTTEQWKVSFGTDSQTSALMTNPIGDFQNWNPVAMTFTAYATSEVLTFLAEGTPGSSEPPIVLLADVQMYDTTGRAPEPSTFAIMGLGFVCLGFAAKRLKKRA